jgi:hypothetical protein
MSALKSIDEKTMLELALNSLVVVLKLRTERNAQAGPLCSDNKTFRIAQAINNLRNAGIKELD